MREHIGVDVDAMYEEDLMASDPIQDDSDDKKWDPDHQEKKGKDDPYTRADTVHSRAPAREAIHEFVGEGAGQGMFSHFHSTIAFDK